MFLATLYRFGYDMTVLAETPKECEQLLLDKYEEIYKSLNDDNPREEIAYDRHSELTYYEEAREDILIRELEIGKVEWM
jgi:hypothetical protein